MVKFPAIALRMTSPSSPLGYHDVNVHEASEENPNENRCANPTNCREIEKTDTYSVHLFLI